MKRILLLDRDAQLVALLRRTLSQKGFHVTVCCDGLTALDLLRKTKPDLVIAERTARRVSGLEICRQIRADSSLGYIPILLLSASDDEVDRVICLELGADGYLTKPLELRELIARVVTLLWRADPEFVIAKSIDLGGVRIDPMAHCLSRGGDIVPVSTLEFRLLHFLVQRPNRIFTRSQLIGAVSRAERLSDKSVDVYIHRLRGKVEDDPQNPVFIKTRRGTGYMLQLS
jgi:DNA-binding response OmpR family regulator